MGKKKTKSILQAWGNARVSSMDQVNNGVSLDAQTEGIRGWRAVNGYQLAGVLVDRGISGGRCSNRPVLQEAMRLVARGNALVLSPLAPSLSMSGSEPLHSTTGLAWGPRSATP